jgi:hypothetical protein
MERHDNHLWIWSSSAIAAEQKNENRHNAAKNAEKAWTEQTWAERTWAEH